MARIPTRQNVDQASFRSASPTSRPNVSLETADQIQYDTKSVGNAMDRLGEAMGGALTAFAKIRKEEEDLRSDSQLADAELEAAKHRLELEQNFERDADYATSRARYEERAKEIGEAAASRISDPEKRAAFFRRYEMDVLRGAHRIEDNALKADIDAKQAALDGLLDNYRARLTNPDLTDEERAQIEEEAETAVIRLAAKGGSYLSRKQARERITKFYQNVEEDRVIALTNAGLYEQARTLLDQPSRLDRMNGGWRTSDKGDQDNQIAVARAALEEGRSPAVLLAIGDIESDQTFSTSSSNSRSSARGIFHFLDENRAWAARNGVPYGDDAESQTKAMIAKMDSDAAIFRRATGRNPKPWEEYILHFQGGPVGTRLLTTDPDAPLSVGLGSRAAVIIEANPNLREYETVGDFLSDYKRLFERRLEKFHDPDAVAIGTLRETQKRALLDRINAAERKAFAQERADLDLLIDDDIASLEAAGAGVTGIQQERVQTMLGEKRYAEYLNKRRVALAKYQATGDMHEMTSSEISERLESLRPKPGEKGFKEQKDIYDTATKRAAQITKLRAKDPAKAVDDIDYVREAASVNDGSPEASQALVRARLKAQAQIGIPPQGRAPITRDEAKAMLAPIASLARAATTDRAASRELPANFETIIKNVEKQYGPYAKSVLDTALQHFTESRQSADRLGRILMSYVRSGKLEARDLRELNEVLQEDAEARALNPDLEEDEDASITSGAQPSLGKPALKPMKDDRPRGEAKQPSQAPSRQSPMPQEYPKPHKGHINLLKQHPEMRDFFDKKFGPGAAARVLGN